MTRARLLVLSSTVALAAAALLAGSCGAPVKPPPVEHAAGNNTLTVTGYVWDPEALEYSFLMCGFGCPLRPLAQPGQAHFNRSLVSGAQAALRDLESARELYYAPKGTEPGLWKIEGVERRHEPYFAWAARDGGAPPRPDSGTSDGGSGDGGVVLAPIPPAGPYLPTVSLNPIDSSGFMCLGRPTAAISDRGILGAVAAYLSAQGTPTAVKDLLDPARFGGVVIWWAHRPGASNNFTPAPGISTEASLGQVVHVNWSDPGNDAGIATNARGFWVGGAPSNVGLSVTLLPKGLPSVPTVTFKLKDTADAADAGRAPWVYPEAGPFLIHPGVVHFGQVFPLVSGPQPHPSEWECLGNE